MDKQSLAELLHKVKAGETPVEEAMERLKGMPYEDLGFAKVDHHRGIRTGHPEVVFCQGKTTDQVVAIVKHLAGSNKNVLTTRVNQAQANALLAAFPTADYNELGRCVVINPQEISLPNGKVLVVSAGTADLPVAEEAAVTAAVMGNRVERLYDIGVAGIHRLLENLTYLNQADVIIVVAGMEGALASVVGGMVDKPVVAVPTSVGYGASFGGLAALLSMLNSCAAGIGVVNIDNGFGAGALAASITRTSLKPAK
ncbi:MAG: nickel pincer cofactor biosynthesis protein LarB [Peptococcaceae bacterium]|nr:nickel pincer cofactor biosynthesis protein LarB [Peptococcaceae bacterium]